MIFLYTLLVSLLTTIALIPALSAVATRFNVVDLPGERKVHERPIPRIGGIAMAAGAILPVILWASGDHFIWGWLAGAAIVVIFGIVDDCKDISPKWKFLGQFLAALVVVLLGKIKIHTLGMLLPGEDDLPGWVALSLTVLAIMGVTNAINLADGLDGLAGGICLLIFCCIGYLAYLEGDLLIGLVCLAMAGAIFGFLRYNTHPATVFMGDTGSQLLGFTAVTLSLALTQGNTAISPVLPLLLLGIPVLDTLSVMTIRVMKGRSPFSADKNHIHHNLMALGLHHGESVMAIYACQTFLVVAAFLLRFHSDWLLLGGYLAFSVASLSLLMVAGRNGWHSKPATDIPRFSGFRYLKQLKEEGEFIKPVFRTLRIGLPLLLALTCLLPGNLPSYAPYCALGFSGLIAASWRFKRDRLGEALRLTVYLFIPFVVYESSQSTGGWIKGVPLRVYNAAFFLLAVLDILVSKFSKRREGFKSTPLDFLIFFLALVVPNLPEQHLQATHLGQVAAKIVIFYFSYEVLMGELRKNLNGLAAGTLAALALLFVKALV
jgi:UDP-GlcNAc:undecaprenyl-phosphate/decaprenyl-phosphate GlcNAc-1-phosphate transferase